MRRSVRPGAATLVVVLRRGYASPTGTYGTRPRAATMSIMRRPRLECNAGYVARAVHLGAQPEGVGQVGDPHGARDAAAQLRARPYEGGGAGGDEVRGVHVGAVGGLRDAQRDVDALRKPLVR